MVLTRRAGSLRCCLATTDELKTDGCTNCEGEQESDTWRCVPVWSQAVPALGQFATCPQTASQHRALGTGKTSRCCLAFHSWLCERRW
jgi:hypothetical protein